MCLKSVRILNLTAFFVVSANHPLFCFSNSNCFLVSSISLFFSSARSFSASFFSFSFSSNFFFSSFDSLKMISSKISLDHFLNCLANGFLLYRLDQKYRHLFRFHSQLEMRVCRFLIRHRNQIRFPHNLHSIL